MLGAIESLLSAVVADSMAHTRHNPNQELVGQGIANVVAPLFGGFAATGALARTATNVRNGGTGPLAGIVHSIMLMLMVLALAPLAANIPLAVLAAILFIVAWNMSDVRHFVRMFRRAPTADAVILITTFLLTVFADLVVAVNIGVLMALLQFLRRMASSVEVHPMSADEVRQELALHGIDALPSGVTAYVLDGPLFFGATEQFERTLGSSHSASDVLIIRLRWVPFIDVTGLQVLDEVIRGLKKRGVQVLLSGANPRVQAKLERAHIIDLVGSEHVFDAFPDAVQWCRAQRAKMISAA
jgi:SulP family sulfate permease